MEKDYKITYDLGNGIQTFTFIATLLVGVAQTFTHQVVETRTLNNGYLMRELATYTFKIIVTVVGVLLTLLLVQRLGVKES